MKRFLVIGLSLTLCACGAEPQKVTPVDARKIADRLTYVQDTRTGLCFATLGSLSTDLAGGVEGIALANVPCETVKHFLVK